ncbi:MAG TPA: hypothetical protein PKK48_07695, partial [Phycisphaerae bacterium]|nr:hypothetical protein [Phycisphaerae bacterium]
VAVSGTNRSVTVRGDFTGSFRAAEGIGTFTADDFSGLLSTDGNLSMLMTRGAMTGLVRAGGTINMVNFASMNGAMVTAGCDLLMVTINGDMINSRIFAGFDPGDSGYSLTTGETGNLRIDAFSAPLNEEQVDSAMGGSIRTVTIRGSMTNSTISAAVAPGQDGYCGTSDDVVAGAGYINSIIRVGKAISGTIVSCGIFAANNMPSVYQWNSRAFSQNGTAHVDTMASAAGLLRVTDVEVNDNSITVYFNHQVNSNTLGTAQQGTVNSIQLLLSDDSNFNSDYEDVLATYAHTINYDSSAYSVTITLSGGLTWDSLPVSEQAYYQLTLSGNLITDNRNVLLDGDYDGTFPSGDGQAGSNFVYNFIIGTNILENVPSYKWWFGCAPTAAGMLIGYYDNTLDGEFITGDANDQSANPNINEMIASSGTGDYEFDAAGDVIINVPGLAGTGNIPDYALYNLYDDSDDDAPYADMSTLNPGGVHEDDSLADFMLTGQSFSGLTMGGTWNNAIGTGIEEYVEYLQASMTVDYVAETDYMVYGIFTWETLVSEIDAGRPVLLCVDSSGDGVSDHAIIAIGYDATMHKYACYTTWSVDDPTTFVDEALEWYDFTSVAQGQVFGISAGITVEIIAA